jgi:hypothetical protein
MKLDAAAKAELKASPRISAVRCKTWISARRPRYQYSGRSSAQRLRFKRYRPATTWKDLPYTCICMHRKDSRFMSNATRTDACHCGSSACSRRQHRLGMRRDCPIETGIRRSAISSVLQAVPGCAILQPECFPPWKKRCISCRRYGTIGYVP